MPQNILENKPMKLIKILTIAILASAVSTASFSQEKKVEFGLMAGYGHTMPRTKPLASGINSDNLNGFHVGPAVKFNVNEQIGFQTGILYNNFSGIRNNELELKKATGTWKQTKTQLTALDIPLRLVYSLTLAEELDVLLYIGPNLNYSLSKTSNTERYVSNSLSKVEPGENIYERPSNFKALDLQLGVGLGLKFYGLSLRAGYDWGVLNRTTLDDVKLRSNDIKVSLGYTF